jgi:hypothetical protein
MGEYLAPKAVFREVIVRMFDLRTLLRPIFIGRVEPSSASEHREPSVDVASALQLMSSMRRTAKRREPKKEVVRVAPREMSRAMRSLVADGLRYSPSPTARAILLTTLPDAHYW